MTHLHTKLENRLIDTQRKSILSLFFICSLMLSYFWMGPGRVILAHGMYRLAILDTYMSVIHIHIVGKYNNRPKKELP